MPELPETETIARDLDRMISGRVINHVTVLRPNVVRLLPVAALPTRLIGQVIVRAWRRAKNVVLDLTDGHRILVQPRFTGVLSVLDAQPAPEALSHECVRLGLDDGRALVYSDVRRLGTFAVANPQQFDDINSTLGVEPLDQEFTSARLSGILRGSGKAVKSVLMDQARIAGCGNIYASEALWRAGIDPSRRASALSEDEALLLRDSLVAVLSESIAKRGTTFRDYRDASGGRGGFSELLSVYGRAGKPCLRCGRRLVTTHAIDGRSTVFCYWCQP